MVSCARRETLEGTGLPVVPGRIAFVLEALGPRDSRRVVDLVFLAALSGRSEPRPAQEIPAMMREMPDELRLSPPDSVGAPETAPQSFFVDETSDRNIFCGEAI